MGLTFTRLGLGSWPFCWDLPEVGGDELFFIGDVEGDFDWYRRAIEEIERRGPRTHSIQVGDVYIQEAPKGPDGAIAFADPARHKFLRGNHDDPAACKASKNYLGPTGVIRVAGVPMFVFIGGAPPDSRYATGEHWPPEATGQELDSFGKLYWDLQDKGNRITIISHDKPQWWRERETDASGLDSPTRQAFYGLNKECVMRGRILPSWVHGHYHKPAVKRTSGTEGLRFTFCVGERDFYSWRYISSSSPGSELELERVRRGVPSPTQDAVRLYGKAPEPARKRPRHALRPGMDPTLLRAGFGAADPLGSKSAPSPFGSSAAPSTDTGAEISCGRPSGNRGAGSVGAKISDLARARPAFDEVCRVEPRLKGGRRLRVGDIVRVKVVEQEESTLVEMPTVPKQRLVVSADIIPRYAREGVPLRLVEIDGDGRIVRVAAV